VKFLRIELSNELFSYGISIRRLNYDTKTICRQYSEMRSGLLRQELSKEQYLPSLTEYQKGLEILIKAYDLMDVRTEALHARTRATLRKDTLHDKQRFYKMPILKDITQPEIDTEIKSLREEIAIVQSQSKSDIEQHLG